MRKRWALLGIVVFLVVSAFAVSAWLPNGSSDLPGRWCDDNEIRAVCYRNWLGAVSGWAAFAAAVVAGWLTWAGVLRQVGIQRQQTQIADRTFWQNERVQAETALEGLRIATAIVGQVLRDFDLTSQDNVYPFLTALRRLHPSGLLESREWPSTGRVAVAWELQRVLSTLRVLYDTYGAAIKNDDLARGEAAVEREVMEITKLGERIQLTMAGYAADLERANETLAFLDSQL